MAAKEKSAAVSKQNELRSKLAKIVKDIDEEGLLSLIEQANIIKYNQEVDNLNREYVKMNADKSKNKDEPKQEIVNEVKIEADPDKKTFVLIIGIKRKFLTREEIRQMTMICQVNESSVEISPRLFNWLKKERSDILIDFNIRDSSNTYVTRLINYIKENYKVKK